LNDVAHDDSPFNQITGCVYRLLLQAEVTLATIFRFDRLGGAATFYLVKPPVNAVDVIAAHAAVGSVHRNEGILTIHTPHVVTEALSPLV
jgi:hypothetical protein